MKGADLLRAYVARTAVTQSDLAARCGVTAPYVSMLLSGDRVVTRLDVACRIEAATGGVVPARSWLPDNVRRVVRRRTGSSARRSPDSPSQD